MDILFEMLFDVLAEMVCVGVRRGALATFGTRAGRWIVLVLAGFGAGVGWGVHVRGAGRVAEPATVRVGLALALAAGAFAVVRLARPSTRSDSTGGGAAAVDGTRPPDYGVPDDRRVGRRARVPGSGAARSVGCLPHVTPPWRMPARHLVGLVALNLATASGVSLGFRPM